MKYKQAKFLPILVIVALNEEQKFGTQIRHNISYGFLFDSAVLDLIHRLFWLSVIKKQDKLRAALWMGINLKM